MVQHEEKVESTNNSQVVSSNDIDHNDGYKERLSNPFRLRSTLYNDENKIGQMIIQKDKYCLINILKEFEYNNTRFVNIKTNISIKSLLNIYYNFGKWILRLPWIDQDKIENKFKDDNTSFGVCLSLH